MKAPSPAGYSGTPLARKLGIKTSSRIFISGAPEGYEALLEPLPADVVFDGRITSATDIAHIFVTEREALAGHLGALRKKLKADASVWVSWPKKASRVATTVTEDVIREIARPLGFIDIKVCAVTDIWSGLKLVVRKELR